MAAGGPFWTGVFDAVQKQGKSPPPDDPKSPSDVYLANLNKADKDPRDGSWYLLFDMVPAEAAMLAFGGRSGDGSPPPTLPTILFHATAALQQNVYGALGLDSADEPAEGSWYVLYLQPDGDPKTDVTGELFHPDADFGTGVTYKTWHIAAADLMFVPTQKGPEVILGVPPAGLRATRGGGTKPRAYRKVQGTGIVKVRRFRVFKRAGVLSPLRRVPPPPPPPPAGYGAIGVMDVGQGGCNLLLDRNLEPAIYYDTGYPLGFFRASLPLTMRADLPGQWLGPIYQNAANNLEIVLSHWDWDHWRLGACPANALGQTLAQLRWTVPNNQVMGPTATMFANALPLVNPVPAGAPAQMLGNGIIRYSNVPPPGAIPAMLINNSGLSLRIPVDLGGNLGVPVLLTGDGNFSGLPAPARAGLAGIGAVHHGSGNHGADQNLPAAPFFGPGYIAYSYGVSSVTGNHAYGFPAPAAVANYNAAQWTAPNLQTTAEGANINLGPLAHGNIRMGNQGAIPDPQHHNTAFFAIGHALP